MRSDRKTSTVQDRQQTPKGRAAPAGLAARDLAHRLIAGVLVDRRPLEQVLADLAERPQVAALEPRDRAFARLLAATVLRRLGELDHVLGAFLERPLPIESGRVRAILLAGAAQLLCLGTPAHAVVDLAVAAARRERGGARFAGLVNAVLRRVADRGAALLEGVDPIALNIPAWLLARWSAAYGAAQARRLAEASLGEAALDISLKVDGAAEAQAWAERLGGRMLPTGSIRIAAHGRVEDLPGYREGAWWVQDAAAALIARVAGDVAGMAVADLCAAPGGKTAGLAAAGAHVTAVDIAPHRLDRLRTNMQRLGLTAEVVTADVTQWSPGRLFDAIVLDAPCTATGTIRRHPDVIRLKHAGDVARMAAVQRAMIANATRLVRPGGTLIYATCSLEIDEGEAQINALVAREPAFVRLPIAPGEIGGEPDWITAAGDLRTLPFHLQIEPKELSGIDGFYVARLIRQI
jgi:16S rRNA (cytosine967-C5)-methyltransferase